MGEEVMSVCAGDARVCVSLASQSARVLTSSS